MRHLLRSFAVATTVAATLAWGAVAQAAPVTLSTIDLTAVGGTSWASLATTPVRVDFGAGYGLGTVSATGLDGGALLSAQVYTGLPNSATLSNGNSFVSTEEIVFTYGPGVTGLGGFTLNVQLDSGVFLDGAVFEVRSLDWRNGFVQYFSPGSGLGAPDATVLLSDGAVPLVPVGSDAQGTFYGPGSPGIGAGLAFAIDPGADAFSGRFLADRNLGGVAFTIALPAASTVPEPASALLVLVGLGALAARGRRKPGGLSRGAGRA